MNNLNFSESWYVMKLSPIAVISIKPIAVKGELIVVHKKYVRMPKRKEKTIKNPVIKLLIWQ
ncbi:hypothetical protein SIL77_05300 [Exiguobacterium profundum]|uniref:hypothetical protein n=1 Tax=Exiguobacterium profundum TaxID=307643 RepID=UPI0029C4F60C|nr:hypothetical protein [Exiguobacterium profundum]MDX5980689.1 hypothetical protein [Exiguobacterium profundum]